MFLRSFVDGLYSFLCYWTPFSYTVWIFIFIVIRDIDFFFQARLYWAPALAAGKEDKQKFPLLAPSLRWE